MKSFHSVIAIVVVLLTASCRSSQPTPRDADVRALLAQHEEVLAAHLASDVDRLLGTVDGPFTVASRGKISSPTLEQRRKGLGPYLRSTRFSIYRDQVPPVVRVSDDGTLGWVIAQVEAKGVQTNGSGAQENVEFVSAWIELYEKRNGVWLSIGNVSNFKE